MHTHINPKSTVNFFFIQSESKASYTQLHTDHLNRWQPIIANLPRIPLFLLSNTIIVLSVLFYQFEHLIQCDQTPRHRTSILAWRYRNYFNRVGSQKSSRRNETKLYIFRVNCDCWNLFGFEENRIAVWNQNERPKETVASVY